MSSDEVTSYAEFGQRVGAAAGQRRVRIIRIPSWISFIGACASELWARIRDQSQILNRDKWREATAGDWVCSSAKIRTELGWSTQATLDESLVHTARAYADDGQLSLMSPKGSD